jgi:hypothetical protein
MEQRRDAIDLDVERVQLVMRDGVDAERPLFLVRLEDGLDGRAAGDEAGAQQRVALPIALRAGQLALGRRQVDGDAALDDGARFEHHHHGHRAEHAGHGGERDHHHADDDAAPGTGPGTAIRAARFAPAAREAAKPVTCDPPIGPDGTACRADLRPATRGCAAPAMAGNVPTAPGDGFVQRTARAGSCGGLVVFDSEAAGSQLLADDPRIDVVVARVALEQLDVDLDPIGAAARPPTGARTRAATSCRASSGPGVVPLEPGGARPHRKAGRARGRAGRLEDVVDVSRSGRGAFDRDRGEALEARREISLQVGVDVGRLAESRFSSLS